MAVIFQRRPFRMRLKGINWHEMEKKTYWQSHWKYITIVLSFANSGGCWSFKQGILIFGLRHKNCPFARQFCRFQKVLCGKAAGQIKRLICCKRRLCCDRIKVQRKRTVGHVSGGNNLRVVLSGQEMNERAAKTAVLPCNIWQDDHSIGDTEPWCMM